MGFPKGKSMRPIEYVAVSGTVALFAGLVVLMVTRDAGLAFISGASTFIIVIIGIAMLLLALTPNPTPDGEKKRPETGND
mgnify:CR=1 FL=1